jgi:hypothetical protein
VLSSIWSVILTVLFAVTGGYSLWRWGDAVSTRGSRTDAEAVVDLNHVLMSAAMVIMVWWPSGTVGVLIQIAAFGVFAVIMMLHLTAGDRRHRWSSAAHVIMNTAMIWMLAVMPLLMPHTAGGQHRSGAHHSDSAGPVTTSAAAIPLWAELISWLAVGLLVATAVWWTIRAIRTSTERAHFCCHAAMGAGMATMIGAMA